MTSLGRQCPNELHTFAKISKLFDGHTCGCGQIVTNLTADDAQYTTLGVHVHCYRIKHDAAAPRPMYSGTMGTAAGRDGAVPTIFWNHGLLYGLSVATGR